MRLRLSDAATSAVLSEHYSAQAEMCKQMAWMSVSPVKEVWLASMNGYAAFAPNPVDFVRALPEQGRVFIRAMAADGNNKDANFPISGVSAMRNKIARACSWSDTPDEPVGTTARPETQ